MVHNPGQVPLSSINTSENHQGQMDRSSLPGKGFTDVVTPTTRATEWLGRAGSVLVITRAHQRQPIQFVRHQPQNGTACLPLDDFELVGQLHDSPSLVGLLREGCQEVGRRIASKLVGNELPGWPPLVLQNRRLLDAFPDRFVELIMG